RGVPQLRLRHRCRGRGHLLHDHLRADHHPAGHRRPVRRRVSAGAAASEALVTPQPRRFAPRRLVLFVLVTAVALLFFVLCAWTIATSFKTIPDSVGVGLIPHPWTSDAWRTIWTQYDFKTYIRN